MISTLTAPPLLRRRRRGFTVGIALGLMAPLALLLALSLIPGGGSSEIQSVPPEIRAQRSALATFEDALAPVVDEGAATVVYGMRPGINDIYDQRFDDATLTTMAEGWVEATQRTRDRFEALEAPAFLAETADLYRQSFDAYHETARALLAAAQAGGEERTALITQAAEHGTRADDLYDAAKAGMAQHRQRLGLTDG